MTKIILISLLFTINAWAGIALSGATYTQTGTDVDVSALAPLAGVETYLRGNKTTYVFTTPNTRFQVNGTLDINPEKEELVFLDSAATDCMRVGNGGLLRVGQSVSIGSILRYAMGDVLTFPRDTAAQFLINSLDVQAGGRFEWRGGTIHAGDPMGCSIGGTAEIFAGRFVTTSTVSNTTNASAMVMRNDGAPDDVICHGVILDSLNPTTAAPVVFSRNGLNTFVFSANAGFAQQRNGTWTDALVLRGAEFANNAFIYDYNFVGNNNNYGTDRVQPAEFFNVDVGTGLRQFSATNNLNGHVAFFQELRVNVTGVDGLPIADAIVRVPTTDHGNRIDDERPLFQNSRTFSNGEFDLSEAATSASGEVFFPELLTGRMWVRNSNTEQLDLYSQSGIAGVDDFTAEFISFNELPSSESLILHSSSEIVVNKVLLPDGSLTEQDEEVVRAYPSISVAPEFYDSAKVYLVDNFKGEQSTIVSIAGTTIDAGAYNVVFNDAALDVFGFDEVSGTITIKSSGFSGGVITDGLVTGKELVTGSVIDNTQDTTLAESNGTMFSVYATELEADTLANPIVSGVTNWGVLFDDVPNDGLVYVRASLDGLLSIQAVQLDRGVNEFSVGLASELGRIFSGLNIVNKNVMEAAARRPARLEFE